SNLAGSQLKNEGLAFGLSRFGEDSQIGFSISVLDAQYGLIGSLEEEPEEAPEAATGLIDMEQVRTDFEAQFNSPFTGIESINFRLGINDYQHQEIEGSGELGTVFENDAWEGRVELNHAAIKGIQGTLGLQMNSREFSAIGEEAFVPPVETQSAGLFWVGEKNFERFDIESGLRIENLQHRPTSSEIAARDFSTFSSSLGIVIPFANGLSVAGLMDYSSRAPSIEELYSNGPHLATQTFEVGDIALKKETAIAFSLTAGYEVQLVSIASTIYQMHFNDFIFQDNTGAQRDELPLFIYRQGDARFTGIDLKADFHLGEIASGDLDINILFDAVRAELSAGENRNLPRIPARRIGLGVAWTNLNWLAKLNYQRVSEQQDVANFELATPSYDDFSIYLKRDFSWGDTDASLFIHGRNLSDQDQRHHASFIKDLAPAPGRRIELGVRLQF
ncbi:MAG: iron complex outermembrane receptor protein, partial [Arenicella sp.]